MVKLLRVLYSILYLIYSVSSHEPSKPPDFVKCVDEKCGTSLYTTKNVGVQSERESSSLLPLNELHLPVEVFSLPNSLGFVLAEVNGRRGLVRANILQHQKPPQSVPVDSFESVNLFTLTATSVFNSSFSDDIGPTAPSRHEHTDSPHNASQTESHNVTDTASAAAVTVTDANVTSDPVEVTTHSESGSSRTPPSNNNNNSSSAVANITGQLSDDTEHDAATLSDHQLSAALNDSEQQQQPEDGQRQSTPAEQQPNPAISENNEQLPSPEQLPSQQLQQQQQEKDQQQRKEEEELEQQQQQQEEKLEQQQQDKDRDHREQLQQQQEKEDEEKLEQQQQDQDRDHREQLQQQQQQEKEDEEKLEQQQQDQDRDHREQLQQQQQEKEDEEKLEQQQQEKEDEEKLEHQQQDQDRDQREQQQQQDVVNNGSSEDLLMATNSSLLTNGSVSAGGTDSVTSGHKHLPGIDKLVQSRRSRPKRSVVSPHSAESVSADSNLVGRDPDSSQSPGPGVAGHAADDAEDVSLPDMSTEVTRPPTDTLGSETSGSEIDAGSDDAHHSKQSMDLHSGESSSDARSRGNGEFSSPEDWQESDPNAVQRSSLPNPAETKQNSETSPSVTDVSGESPVSDGFCVGNAFGDPLVGSCRDTDRSGGDGLSPQAEEPSPEVAGSVEVSDVISNPASDAGFDQDSLSTDTSSQTPDVETPEISREQEQEPDGVLRSTIDGMLPAWLCVLLDGAAGGSGGGGGGPARVTVLLCSVGLTLTLLTTCFRLTTIVSRDFSLKRTISRQQRSISVLTQQVKQLMREADSHSRQLTEVGVQERDEALMAARADRQAVEQQLAEAQDEIGRLSGEVAQLQQLLEEQNSSLQSAQSGANAAIVDTVNKLERQLKQQQRKQLAVVDKLKLENKQLLAELNADKEQLTTVLSQLQESRGAVETKSRDLQELQLKVQLSTDNCQQLEDKCTELNGQQLTLGEQLAELDSERTRLQSLLHEAQERAESLASQVTVLTDLVKQQQQDQSPDSDTQPDGDPCQQLLDAVKLKAQLDKLTRDKAKLEEERQQQQQQLESLQERESSVRSELEAVGKRCEQTELAKYEAESKLDHLEKYFHKKELAFHEEVGELKHRVSLTSGDASLTQQRLQQLTAETAQHQRLVDSLKLEIQEQERSFRERLQSVEKEAHESWLARRAAERRLEQANREAAQIRAMLLQREEVNGSSLTDRASLHSLAVNGALATDSPVQDVEAAMYGKPSMMGFMTPSPPPPMSLPFLPPPPPSSSQPLSLDARSDSLFYEPPPLLPPPPPLAPPVLNERRSAPYSPSPRRRGSSPTADSEYSRHSSGRHDRHRHQRRHHLDYEQQQQRHLHGGSGRRLRHAHSSDDTSGNDTRDEGARYTPEPPPLMMPTGGHSGVGAQWSPPRPMYDQNDVKELGGTVTRLYRPQPVSGPKTSSPLVLTDSYPQ